MKAIILAAGVGSRLRPITDQKPKTMVEVNGKPMLGYILEALHRGGVNDVIICTGYRAEAIEDYCYQEFPHMTIKTVLNADFETTNNMYSLHLARAYIDGEILLMNADLVFDSDIIERLVCEKGTRVAVDQGTYNEESMKITLRDDGTIDCISKKISQEKAWGSSIDVYRICSHDIPSLLHGLDHFIEELEDKKQWTEVLLNDLFASGKVLARPFSINPSKWFEIDNFEDLAKAELLFNERVKELRKRKIFFLDRDGTLSIKNEAIPGGVDFLNTLRQLGKKIYLLTNNSSRTPEQHMQAISKIGLDFSIDEILVSIDACLEEFRTLGITRAYWMANSSVTQYIEDCGFSLDEKDPQALLLTYDDELTYSKLTEFCSQVRKGTPYYATHIDMVCPTPRGAVPDIGSFIDVIEEATGHRPIKTFGKPAIDFVRPFISREDATLADCVIVGDRLYTDIAMTAGTDAFSVLVLSGETDRSMYEFSKQRADLVVPSIKTLFEILRNGI